MPPSILRTVIRNIPTVAPVSNRSILSLGGSQASEFLNGILTSSVIDGPGPGSKRRTGHRPMFSTFLHAQVSFHDYICRERFIVSNGLKGRVIYDVFIYTFTSSDSKPSYLIDYESRESAAPPLLSMLKRYVLRSKVKLRDVSEEYDVWAVWGSDSAVEGRNWNWARSGAVEPDWTGETEWPWGKDDKRIRDRRGVGMGERLLVRKGDRRALFET